MVSILRTLCRMQPLHAWWSARCYYFNLTHPLWDATFVRPEYWPFLFVSILRTPCGMQHIIGRHQLNFLQFQSYASLVGCNLFRFPLSALAGNFNLMHPLRDATYQYVATFISIYFNLTHPLLGATATLYNCNYVFTASGSPSIGLFISAKLPVNLCILDVRTSYIQCYYTNFYKKGSATISLMRNRSTS